LAQQKRCSGGDEATAESWGRLSFTDGLIEFQLLRQSFQLRSRSGEMGDVIETHEHAGDFNEP
jgi:hypothetical protein